MTLKRHSIIAHVRSCVVSEVKPTQDLVPCTTPLSFLRHHASRLFDWLASAKLRNRHHNIGQFLDLYANFMIFHHRHGAHYGLGAMITSTVSCPLEWFLTPWGSPARAIVAIPFFRIVEATPTLNVPSPFWTI